MKLRAGRKDAIKNPERKGRFRKFGAAVKRTTKKAARNALFIGSLLVSGLMLSGNANAEEKTAKRAEKSLSARIMGGAYNKGQDPYVGVGLSGHLGYEHVKFDAMIDGIFKDFKSAELDHAELDVTFPIHDYFALTPFVYRSQYYGGVNTGAGITFHIPKLNLHVAPHWCDGNSIAVPISYTPNLGKLSMMVGVVLIPNHKMLLDKSDKTVAAPILGTEVRMSYEVADGVKVYLMVFDMMLRDGNGKMSMGTANAQAGVEMDF